MSLVVVQPGILSLLQDSGRRGHHRIGLTGGGPLDPDAYTLCNRLLSNTPGSTAIEISAGGLRLRAAVDTWICLTGATMPLLVNDEEQPRWQAVPVKAGDDIALGYATRGCRAYLGVAEGFAIAPMFGSTATVPREGIGGLRGQPLRAGDELPCAEVARRRRLCLEERHRPRYHKTLTVRVVPGYQHRHFDRRGKRSFFSTPYTVSERCDRMGYRLEGATVACEQREFLSEGICYGAIQVPPDGQPIVLLNDRQTIGGYPKLGSALSLDAARLTQLVQGSTVHFTPVSRETAQRALRLGQRFAAGRPLREI